METVTLFYLMEMLKQKKIISAISAHDYYNGYYLRQWPAHQSLPKIALGLIRTAPTEAEDGAIIRTVTILELNGESSVPTKISVHHCVWLLSQVVCVTVEAAEYDT